MAKRIVAQIREALHDSIWWLDLTSLILVGVAVAGATAVNAQEGMVKIQAANLHMSGDSSIDLPGAATQKSSANDACDNQQSAGFPPAMN